MKLKKKQPRQTAQDYLMCKHAGRRTSPRKQDFWKVRALNDGTNSVVGNAIPYRMNGRGFEPNCGINIPKYPDRARGSI